MHDLSLYVLELIENSVRAGAATVVVTVAADPTRDELAIGVDDDGPGLDVSADQATDPFYTTKQGKRTGLGLFGEAAEAAGGHLTVHRAGGLGGVGVTAVLRLSHVDRPPLGDMAQTVAVTAATTPGVELRLEVAVAGDAATATGAELLTPGPAAERCAALLASIDEHPTDTSNPTPTVGATVENDKRQRSVG